MSSRIQKLNILFNSYMGKNWEVKNKNKQMIKLKNKQMIKLKQFLAWLLVINSVIGCKVRCN